MTIGIITFTQLPVESLVQQVVHRLVALLFVAKDNVHKVGDSDAGKRTYFAH